MTQYSSFQAELLWIMSKMLLLPVIKNRYQYLR